MPIAPNTVALYNFENNGLDSSGNGYDLVVNGVVPFTNDPTKVSQGAYAAGQFSDANYFSMPAGFKAAWTGLNAWTVEFYAYVQSFGVNDPVLIDLSDSNGQWTFQIRSNGTFAFVTNNQSAINTGAIYAPGTKVNIGITFDGNNVKIYMNNVVVATSGNGFPGSTGNPTTDQTLGRFGLLPLFSLAGYLDQLRFSNVARTTFPTVDPGGGGGGAALNDTRMRR